MFFIRFPGILNHCLFVGEVFPLIITEGHFTCCVPIIRDKYPQPILWVDFRRRIIPPKDVILGYDFLYEFWYIHTSAEILGDTYHRQVPLPRIPNNQAQDSTWDSAQPYVQTLGTYSETKLGQRKPEQPFIQRQRRTDVINSYTDICTY